MSISTTFGSGGTIESASALIRGSPPGAVPAAHASSQDMIKHQRAMTQRLEQLNAALGEDKTSKTIPWTAPATENREHPHGAARLILTGVLSALLGAGLTWIAKPSGSVVSTETARPQQAFAGSFRATPAAAPATSVAPKPESSDEQQIATLLENWRSAWAQRDTTNYLSTYSKDFAPADGSARDTWVASRKKKLSAATAIDVQLSKLAIERIDGNHFKASFLQDYASGNYRETARAKTLLITRENGAWRITREWLEK